MKRGLNPWVMPNRKRLKPDWNFRRFIDRQLNQGNAIPGPVTKVCFDPWLRKHEYKVCTISKHYISNRYFLFISKKSSKQWLICTETVSVLFFLFVRFELPLNRAYQAVSDNLNEPFSWLSKAKMRFSRFLIKWNIIIFCSLNPTLQVAITFQTFAEV